MPKIRYLHRTREGIPGEYPQKSVDILQNMNFSRYNRNRGKFIYGFDPNIIKSILTCKTINLEFCRSVSLFPPFRVSQHIFDFLFFLFEFENCFTAFFPKLDAFLKHFNIFRFNFGFFDPHRSKKQNRIPLRYFLTDNFPVLFCMQGAFFLFSHIRH